MKLDTLIYLNISRRSGRDGHQKIWHLFILLLKQTFFVTQVHSLLWVDSVLWKTRNTINFQMFNLSYFFFEMIILFRNLCIVTEFIFNIWLQPCSQLRSLVHIFELLFQYEHNSIELFQPWLFANIAILVVEIPILWFALSYEVWWT